LSNELLSRYAENIFWLARFVERAENLARILDVNETFTRDSRGTQNWQSIVQLNADEVRFQAKHPIATEEAVLRFYVTDATNPTSLISAIRNARENARNLRPFISTEMWVHLNVFYNRLRAVDQDELAPGRLTKLLASIKQDCQTQTGITEGTFFRDQGWYFAELGRYIERADQTTRLLDIKYHLLLPRPSDVGSPIDASQWNALLRSVAAYHAYRRIHATGITPSRVAEFLLLNPDFPRSVILCVAAVDTLLREIKSRYSLTGGDDALAAVEELHRILDAEDIERILGEGLHEFVDSVQRRLITITDRLSVAFFGRMPTPPSQVGLVEA
jgi:uncharacterized alpha-E superfamily protein